MSKKSYSEQLKDPRWQKRRLEIMKKNDFSCQECEETDKTLHIHHGTYLRDKSLWEYPDKLLHCLCEDCHQRLQVEFEKLTFYLGTLSGPEITEINYNLEIL
jgi:5-methylcytosine-specific restriction endonuclease McrA